jgi:hypothetical protein
MKTPNVLAALAAAALLALFLACAGAGLGAFLLAGRGRGADYRELDPPPGDKDSGPPPGDRSAGPSTEAERVALRYVVENEDDPASVRVIRFGPHDDLPAPDGMTAVRVRYRAKNRFGALEVFVAAVYLKGGRAVDWSTVPAEREALLGRRTPPAPGR